MADTDTTNLDGGWCVVADDGLLLLVSLSEQQAREAAASESMLRGSPRHAVPIELGTRMARERQRLHDSAMIELRKRQRLAAQEELDTWREQQAVARAQELWKR